MCGIAGVLNLDVQQPADPQVLARMLDSIIHRGPDDQGQLVDGPLAMGMRRLSIIDLSGGHQPIYDESQRFGIVYNGEVYNYRELQQELQNRGHRLQTNSDTEVVVHLFEERGPDCLTELRGMFGFAVWDSRERELFIARDRLGIKPLYYLQIAGKLIFASEIKAILQHPAAVAELDPHALSDYLTLKYVPAPGTMFRGIKCLPAGHWLRVRQGHVEIQRYWDMEFTDTNESHVEKPEAAYAAELSDLLRESVRLRLRCDVPFGAFLSGGVDSSLIVALMSDILEEPVKTFSVGFAAGQQRDELPYARQVADRFGTDHHEIVVQASDLAEHAQQVMWHLDQPIADQATIATYMVAKLAAQHVKMVCTGEGGDELFAGYARYGGERFSSLAGFVPSAVGRLVQRSLPLLPGGRRAKIALHALAIRNEPERFANWFCMYNSLSKQQVLSATLRQSLHGHHTYELIAEHLSRTTARQPLNRMLYTDSKLWLVDYLLLRGDKLTMANSLEARVPLLDHKLVEFAAKLPVRLKLKGSIRKYLLKKVASRWLPDEIIHRKKEGFTIPLDHWLRHEMRPLMRDTLSRDALQRRNLFDTNYVERLVREHESGFADHGALLWGLMSVEIWHEQFIDRSPAGVTCAQQPVSRVGVSSC